jgi:hypothetical protein
MKKRLLFNRIDMNRTGISVDQAVIFPIAIFSHLANASLPLGHPATVRTQLALDFSSVERSEIGRQFRLDESLRGRLCAGPWKAKETGGGEHAEACTAEPQELSLCQSGIG